MFKHLRETNQNYIDHAKFACQASGWLLAASFTSFVHALFPNLFPFVAEEITKRLAKESQERQLRRGKNGHNKIS